MAINQAYLFLIFSLNGICIGFLFDFFRILRKSFKTTNLVTYVEDILFWILTGISIIFSMYNFANGELRSYMFLGLALGIAIYMLALSKTIIKIFVTIILILKQIIKKVFYIVIFPLKSIILFLNKKLLNPIIFIIVSKKKLKNKK